jgi:hypothetical protein
MTTLQRRKHEGGWGLPHVAIKFKTLLYHRLLTLGARDETVTSDLLRFWHVQEALTNPTYVPRIPAKLFNLRHLVIDMAYVAPGAPDETRYNFKRRLYSVLLLLAMNGSPPSEMRIVWKFPRTNWDQVLKNLHDCPATDKIKSTWYKALHDLIPTNDRLAAIHLTDTSACSSCGHLDSLQHRVMECEEGPIIWTWTNKLFGYMLRVDLRYIPPEWHIGLAFLHWPAQKHAAVLWVLAHLDHYRLQAQRRLSLWTV